LTLYYQILGVRKIPGEVLTYSYQEELEIGQLVKILIRGKLIDGIIYKKINKNEINFDISKVKEVSTVLPAKILPQHIQFLDLLSFNTFNSKNDLAQNFLQAFNLLTKNDWVELESKNLEVAVAATSMSPLNSQEQTLKQIQNNENKPEKEISLKYELENNYLLRIIYLIRSLKSDQIEAKISLDKPPQASLRKAEKKSSSSFLEESGYFTKNILIIFPEQKLLDKIYSGLEKEFLDQENVRLFQYGNIKNKKAKDLVRNLVKPTIPSEQTLQQVQGDKDGKVAATPQSPLESSQPPLRKMENPVINIYCTTRSGMFLPFTSLDHIILLDEANSMYIQEQNRVYFDTREVVFLLAKAFDSDLTFLSSLPSLRFFKNYKTEDFARLIESSNYNQEIPFKINLLPLDPKDKNHLLATDLNESKNSPDLAFPIESAI
jgi:primosomal protein N'